MEQARDIRNITLDAFVAASRLSGLVAINLITFTPNTPIRSYEVNTNFSNLKANIEALQASVGVSRIAINGTAADGKVLKLKARNIVQHIRPMTQDFYVAFGLNGTDSTHINGVDANGVAFAVVKNMYEKNRALEQQIKTPEARLPVLEKAVRTI